MRAVSTKLARDGGVRHGGELVNIDPVIGTVLRWGVLLAAAVILTGVALYVIQAGLRPIVFAPRGVPPGAESNPTSVRAVLDELGPRQPAAVTDLGLLLLIVTPVINVAIALAAFALERDWMYVGIAGFVLAMLIVGFAVGKA
jgi:uncharacterized membrane protein